MGFRSFVNGLLGREERADTATSTATASSAWSADVMLLKALESDSEMNAERAMEIPALSAGINYVANKVAALPIKLYEEDANNHKTKEITEDNRLFLLNDESDPELMNAIDAKRAQIRDMYINGAGYLYIDRGGRGVRSLRYVESSAVSVMKNSDPIYRRRDISIGGKRYTPFDFVILTRNSTDGVSGKGIVDENKLILTSLYNSLRYESLTSGTGGSKKGFLQSETKLDDAAMAKLRATWNEMHAKAEYNVMVLNKGLTYVPSGTTSVEMQLNQSKETNSAQVAMLIGLGTAVLNGQANSAEFMSAAMTAIQPVVEVYQAALNRSLLLESEKGRRYFTLDMTELLKGDMLTRYQAYEIALRNNFLQPDEVRYREDLPALGFNYLKLGLQDVLLDPVTGTIYTPNTNKSTKMGEDITAVENSDEEKPIE